VNQVPRQSSHRRVDYCHASPRARDCPSYLGFIPHFGWPIFHPPSPNSRRGLIVRDPQGIIFYSERKSWPTTSTDRLRLMPCDVVDLTICIDWQTPITLLTCLVLNLGRFSRSQSKEKSRSAIGGTTFCQTLHHIPKGLLQLIGHGWLKLIIAKV